ncbi:hypothetical protein L9F63_017755, partial [Diploptera punctata]
AANKQIILPLSVDKMPLHVRNERYLRKLTSLTRISIQQCTIDMTSELNVPINSEISNNKRIHSSASKKGKRIGSVCVLRHSMGDHAVKILRFTIRK